MLIVRNLMEERDVKQKSSAKKLRPRSYQACCSISYPAKEGTFGALELIDNISYLRNWHEEDEDCI